MKDLDQQIADSKERIRTIKLIMCILVGIILGLIPLAIYQEYTDQHPPIKEKTLSESITNTEVAFGVNSFEFTANDVYLNARRGQRFFIISTTTITNQAWPIEEPKLNGQYFFTPTNIPIPTNAVPLREGGWMVPN